MLDPRDIECWQIATARALCEAAGTKCTHLALQAHCSLPVGALLRTHIKPHTAALVAEQEDVLGARTAVGQDEAVHGSHSHDQAQRPRRSGKGERSGLVEAAIRRCVRRADTVVGPAAKAAADVCQEVRFTPLSVLAWWHGLLALQCQQHAQALKRFSVQSLVSCERLKEDAGAH